MNTPPTENYIRALRDRIYRDLNAKEQNCSTENWNACFDRWMQPSEVKWLEEMNAKEAAKEAQRKWPTR